MAIDIMNNPTESRGWGGKREGAGRPATPESERRKMQKEMRSRFNAVVDEHWDEIMASLIKQASRNPTVAQYLVDQRIGRPTQPTEHSGELTVAIPILGGKSVHSDNGNQPDSQSQETN